VKLQLWRRRGPTKFQRAAEGSMTLVEHLMELRNRLFKATLAIAAGLAVGYWLADPVFDLLKRPYCQVRGESLSDCGSLLWLAPTDPFVTRLKIALYIGLIITAPIWLYQVWAFIAPGLHRHERKWAYGFGALAIPLFVIGSVLAYVVVDRGLKFLLEAGVTGGADIENIQLEATRYLSFIIMMILVFGLAFQFPTLVLLLNFSGLVSAERLLRAWRSVVFACFAFAAVFTPDPGPFGMILLAGSLTVLYFAAVGVAFLHDRRKARQDPYADLSPDEISPLDDDLEPVEPPEPIEEVPVPAGDPVAAASPIAEPAPLDRRYDDMI
jgi:sec-independent protein translocase protein TatC